MHDIRAIRENPDAFDAALARRGDPAVSSELLALDEARRAAILASETAQAEANAASKQIGAAKAKGDEAEFERLRALVSDKKAEIARLTEEAREKDAALTHRLAELPNLPAADVPDGADEDDNVELHRRGTPRVFNFPPKEHYELAKNMSGGMSLAAGLLAQSGQLSGLFFENSAALSGSRFVVMSGAIARLHRALAQFMMDVHVQKNELREMWVPVLVKEEAMFGTGQLPKFADDSYETKNNWWLIPTAEVPLTNLAAGGTFLEEHLPLRFVAHSQCFRSEAGSAGRDTAGMLRQHQFEKVEMVSITHPDASDDEQKRMLGCAEGILDALDIPYRTIVLCTGDMGFGARRTFDIEAWLPGQSTYREISSVSTTGDFQARRMNARFRPAGGGKPEFVHTLNGSGLAVGRCLIAVLENGQQEDGSVTLPGVLAPYLGGANRITAEGVLA